MTKTIAQALQPKNLIVFSDEDDYVYLLNECARAGLKRAPKDPRCTKELGGTNALIILDNNTVQETHSDHHVYDLHYYGAVTLHNGHKLRKKWDVTH